MLCYVKLIVKLGEQTHDTPIKKNNMLFDMKYNRKIKRTDA